MQPLGQLSWHAVAYNDLMGHAFQGEQAFKQTAVSHRANELYLGAYQESNYLEEPSTYMRFLTGKQNTLFFIIITF